MKDRKILVAVDLQNDFIDGALGTKEAEAIVPAAAARIREWREDGAEVFATLDTHEENYAETQEGKRLPVAHCIRGTEGWQLNPVIREALGDCILVEKPTFGSIAEGSIPGSNDPGQQRLLRRCDAGEAQGGAGNHGKLPDRYPVINLKEEPIYESL